MAARHQELNTKAIATLRQKTDRVSRITDGFGDFCFWPEPLSCIDCGFEAMRAHFPGRQAISNAVEDDIIEDFSSEHTNFIAGQVYPTKCVALISMEAHQESGPHFPSSSYQKKYAK
jgi:hypothetical protein